MFTFVQSVCVGLQNPEEINCQHEIKHQVHVAAPKNDKSKNKMYTSIMKLN